MIPRKEEVSVRFEYDSFGRLLINPDEFSHKETISAMIVNFVKTEVNNYRFFQKHLPIEANVNFVDGRICSQIIRFLES